MTVKEFLPTLAYANVPTELTIDDVREPIEEVRWEFTVTSTSLLEVSGMIYGEYVADEVPGFDPTRPLSLSAQPHYREIGSANWRGMGSDLWGRPLSAGANIRDAKAHYMGLPLMFVEELEPGNYEVTYSIRSGNLRLDDLARAAIFKENQNLVKYQIIPLTISTPATPPPPATPDLSAQECWAELGRKLGYLL